MDAGRIHCQGHWRSRQRIQVDRAVIVEDDIGVDGDIRRIDVYRTKRCVDESAGVRRGVVPDNIAIGVEFKRTVIGQRAGLQV